MKVARLIPLILLASCLASLAQQAQPAQSSAPQSSDSARAQDPSSATSQVIDRLIAIVNRQIILQSDWDEAVRYEAFMAGKSLDELTPTDAASALDRLIDQELVRQQMSSLGSAAQAISTAELDDKLTEIRKLYPDGDTAAGWSAALARYGLPEKTLDARLSRQLEAMRFIDMRLRPEARVTPEAVENYYREKLLPQLGSAADRNSPPSADVTAKIQELLTQEKIDELLASWLHGLREQAEIHVQSGPEVLLGSLKSAANRAPAQAPSGSAVVETQQ
jgi:hypothetical protein